MYLLSKDLKKKKPVSDLVLEKYTLLKFHDFRRNEQRLIDCKQNKIH